MACNHPVFPILRAKLVAVKVIECPTCLLRRHVSEIAETQAALERRGGVFTSRDSAIDEQGEVIRKEMVAHKTLVRRWRFTKIDLYKDLSLLESLRAEGAERPRWERQLDKAFEFWEQMELECSRMPGYSYSQEDDCLVNKEVNKASRTTNKAHVDNHATIICDSAARGTTGLPPEQTSYRQPHSAYTAAEDARMRCEFDRQSDLYAPFTWALQDQYENVNTSHCGTPWTFYHLMNLVEDLKESSKRLIQ